MGSYGHLFKLFVKYCPNTLSGLTRLKLENLRLLESDFHELFGLFKQLEFLRLDNCGMKFPSLLEVEHPRLRELAILRSSFETVDLKWLPELRTLTFSCWLPQHDDPLSFGHVPLLHTVSISNKAGLSHKMLKLSEFLRKTTLSNLHVNFQSEKIWVKPEGLRELSQVFKKLRFVNLSGISEECDLTWTMFVLHGAPFLEELCIRVCDCLGIWEKKTLTCSKERKDADAKWETSASDFKHHNLSVLRIIGFQSEDKFVNYITAVMESAVNLKEIYLHEKPVCEKCMYDHRPKNRYPRTKSQRTLVINSFGMDMRPLLTLHFPSLREQCNGSAG
ncbi:uncharacterized protein LOC124690984 [Lolium rigidum]|uniref:uncharacterized protein LOC124690984 n=1 Tax=Lolium rigidum TaxID=89674 RepID=UPI001F5C85B8|nr:uncharacterized protein LOC124690984 [Lolium rigidum]